MKPPMRNEAIIIFEDRTQQPDRHGEYPKIETHTKARVNFSTKTIKQPNGVDRQASLEVDLPPIINLNQGYQIKAKDNFDMWHTAEIIDIQDATNLAGNRVLYRTVFCA